MQSFAAPQHVVYSLYLWGLWAVFDFDLQMRFWRSVTDAMVHSAQASMAAASAWQDVVLASPGAIKTADPEAPVWPFFAAVPDSNPWFPAARSLTEVSPWVEIFWRQSADMMPMTETAWGSIPQANPAAMLAPFWGWAASPWAFMQTPLTAMMMQAGFPYAVASPSAKAGTAAMDAADAARQQMDNVFASYRSDGGHAAARITTSPWDVAASLMTADVPPAGHFKN